MRKNELVPNSVWKVEIRPRFLFRLFSRFMSFYFNFFCLFTLSLTITGGSSETTWRQLQLEPILPIAEWYRHRRWWRQQQ